MNVYHALNQKGNKTSKKTGSRPYYLWVTFRYRLQAHAISLYLDLRRFTLRTQPDMHAIAAQKEDCEQALSSRVDLVLNDLPHRQVPGSLNISWEQAISELTTINSAQKDLLSAMVLDLRRRPI
jgi:hypothetical protein